MVVSNTITIIVKAPLTLAGSETRTSLGKFPQCAVGGCDGTLIQISISLQASGGTPPYTYSATYADGVTHTSGALSGSWSDTQTDCCLGSTVQCTVTDSVGATASVTLT
jgi:hypothetical protein